MDTNRRKRAEATKMRNNAGTELRNRHETKHQGSPWTRTAEIKKQCSRETPWAQTAKIVAKDDASHRLTFKCTRSALLSPHAAGASRFKIGEGCYPSNFPRTFIKVATEFRTELFDCLICAFAENLGSETALSPTCL